MKLKLYKQKISYAEADRLIERYYDGETTVAEEKLLQEFLMSDRLPQKYDAEKAIFGYLKSRKEVAGKSFVAPVYVRWAAVVALLLSVGLSTMLYTERVPDNYAMVNGKLITDNNTLQDLMNSSIADISDNNNEVQQSLNEINNTNLINEQLEVFSGIE